ncbi:MAG: glycosyltransferase, partial [Ilumatobacteraceae bacterium]
MTTEPRIRIVVLTYDGGQMTIDCLTSIRALDWPPDRLEVVLVDNGSLDDVAERVRREFPEVVVLEPLANLGFAGGCNLGIRHGVEGSLAEHFDHVALINNDATIESTWLRSMVAAMEDADDIGGVASKMLFADRFHGLTINVDGVEASDPGRALGVCLSAVRINEARDDDRLRFDEGFHG